MGQNTGTSNMVNSVIAMPMQMDFIDDHLQHMQGDSCYTGGVQLLVTTAVDQLLMVQASSCYACHQELKTRNYQNLNSGKRRTNGLNS